MVIVCAFILLYTSSIIVKSYNRNDLKLFDYILFWFAFIYAFVPIFIYYDWNSYMHPHFKKIIVNKNFFFESLIVLLSFLALIIGYKTYNPRGFVFKIKALEYIKVYRISIWMFIIGALSFIYFVYSYGGLSYILNNVSQIRSGTDENKNYLGAFVKMFSSFITYGFILQLFLYHKGFFKRNKFKFLTFIFITSAMVTTSLLDGGRAGMISKFIYIVLAIYFLKGKIKNTYILLFGFVALFIIVFGKTFIFTMFSSDQEILFSEVRSAQSDQGYLNLFIYEFNHQFLGLSNFIQNNYDFRYMKDYFIWFLKPMKLIDGDPFYDSISYYNTYIIQGNWGSDIPPGLVGLSYINGGVIMVIIQNLVLGRFLKLVENSMRNSNFRENGLLFLTYMYLFNYSWFALQNGDIALILQSGIVFLLFIILMVMFKGVKILRNA